MNFCSRLSKTFPVVPSNLIISSTSDSLSHLISQTPPDFYPVLCRIGPLSTCIDSFLQNSKTCSKLKLIISFIICFFYQASLFIIISITLHKQGVFLIKVISATISFDRVSFIAFFFQKK